PAEDPLEDRFRTLRCHASLEDEDGEPRGTAEAGEAGRRREALLGPELAQESPRFLAAWEDQTRIVEGKFVHGPTPPSAHGICEGKHRMPSRRATNRHAVTRSAVEPGFRLCPSARSQASRSRKAVHPAAVWGQPLSSTCCAR